MDTPNWRQILGGTVGVALLGTIGYYGQGRIRTDSSPQKFTSNLSKPTKKGSTPSTIAANNSEVDRDALAGDFNVPPPPKLIKVDISGEVQKPGVYELAEGRRVEDLIKLAGGLKPTADQSGINLALKLKDELKIVVPHKVSTEKMSVQPVTLVPEGPIDNGPGLGGSFGRHGTAKNITKSTKKQPPSSPISINSASEVELSAIPGIGPAMAKRIVDFRVANGGFSTIEDLAKVKGMGGKTLDRVRQWVTL
jgi:competence protein ComEA